MAELISSDALLGGEPGVPVTLLPADDSALADALAAADTEARQRTVVASAPAFVSGWAALGEAAERRGVPIEAYAYFRVGYHRGLDRLRANGWRGAGRVPWSHQPNQGFLRCLLGLRRMAAVIGEDAEVGRITEFLGQLDPTLAG
ncbi:MAG: DUF3151 domain-containing protein [Chloroflexota bacterium]